MKETCDEVNLQSKSSDSNSMKSSSSSIFAEALVPVNIRYWPSYIAGSVATAEGDILEKIKTPVNNLLVTQDYLASCKSDVEYRSHLYQVAEDTTTVNAMCIADEEVGGFMGGMYANQVANGYKAELELNAKTIDPVEKLNLEIFKQTAQEQGIDPDTVKGTGCFREHVPDILKGDICNRPPRNTRPTRWSDNDGWINDDGPSGNGPSDNGPSDNGPSDNGPSDSGPSDSGWKNDILEAEVIDVNKNDLKDVADNDLRSLTNNNQGIFNKMFGFFENLVGRSDSNAIGTPLVGNETESDFLEKICCRLGGLIPDEGGVYHCTDPSQLQPPPFMGDIGNMCHPENN